MNIVIYLFCYESIAPMRVAAGCYFFSVLKCSMCAVIAVANAMKNICNQMLLAMMNVQ